MERFPLVLTIRAAQWLDEDMAAVDWSDCCFHEGSVSCQPCKPTGYCLQVFQDLQEVDDLKVNGRHFFSDFVDSGLRHSKNPEDHLYDAPLSA